MTTESSNLGFVDTYVISKLAGIDRKNRFIDNSCFF